MLRETSEGTSYYMIRFRFRPPLPPPRTRNAPVDTHRERHQVDQTAPRVAARARRGVAACAARRVRDGTEAREER